MHRWSQFLIFATCVVFTAALFYLSYSANLGKERHEFVLDPITRVSPAQNGEDIQQIWASADPFDGQYLIACGMAKYPLRNVTTGYVYSSGDAGRHWHRTMLENATKWVSEESCTYAADGRAYFVAGESDTSKGEPRHEWGHLVVFVSNNHGMTWNKIWKRKDGWIDWTSLSAIPASHSLPPSLVIFGNAGTDRLGHLSKSLPVAIVSHDGGHSFSNLISPPPPSGFRYTAGWASGSAALPDGTALFATATSIAQPKEHLNSWYRERLRVEVFAYSPSKGIVRSRALVHSIKNAIVFTVTMAQARSRARFGGRLYTAWIESTRMDGGGALWLATSDDRGYHWLAQHILSSGCVHNIKIAVANNGTLGILWSETYTRLRFAVSRDGGKTFSPSITIARHETGTPAVSDGVAINEYWAAAVRAMEAGKSTDPYSDQEHLGVSIRTNGGRGIDDYAIIADANNVFHAVWSQVEPDGTHALFTRAIHSIAGERSVPFSAFTAACPANGEQGHTAYLPNAVPILKLPDARDVSDSFFLRIQNTRYDNVTHEVFADVVLLNKGKTVMRAPLSFFGIKLHSDYGPVIAENATGMIRGQPFWDASSIIPANGLQPSASSKPLALRFKITDFQPLQNGDNGGDVAAMGVRIYQMRAALRQVLKNTVPTPNI